MYIPVQPLFKKILFWMIPSSVRFYSSHRSRFYYLRLHADPKELQNEKDPSDQILYDNFLSISYASNSILYIKTYLNFIKGYNFVDRFVLKINKLTTFPSPYSSSSPSPSLSPSTSPSPWIPKSANRLGFAPILLESQGERSQANLLIGQTLTFDYPLPLPNEMDVANPDQRRRQGKNGSQRINKIKDEELSPLISTITLIKYNSACEPNTWRSIRGPLSFTEADLNRPTHEVASEPKLQQKAIHWDRVLITAISSKKSREDIKRIATGKKGVYIFWSPFGKAILVGSSVNSGLQNRISTYFQESNLRKDPRLATQYLLRWGTNDMYLTLDIFHENTSKEEVLALEQSYIDLLKPWTNINACVNLNIDRGSYNKLSKSQQERIIALFGVPIFLYYKTSESLLLISKFPSITSFIEVTGVGWGTLQNYLNTNALLHKKLILSSQELKTNYTEKLISLHQLRVLMKDLHSQGHWVPRKIVAMKRNNPKASDTLNFKTVTACAEYFHVHRKTIDNWIKKDLKGEIPERSTKHYATKWTYKFKSKD